MTRVHLAAATLATLSAALLGGKCGAGGGGGGEPSVRSVQSPDPRCAALGSQFPPGFDFVPGSPQIAWVADLSPPTLIPFDVDFEPPQAPAGAAPFLLPFDSDGDGIQEGSAAQPLAPILDGVAGVAPDLALVTASAYEEVIFFAPDAGALRRFDVSVPATSARSDNPLLPDPGSTESRTALSTFACVRPPAGALDSRGDPIASSVPVAGFCDASVPSYLASFTSGAVVAAGHLFVSMSNVGDDAGTANTQYLPGAVLVYDIDLAASPPRVSPNAAVPVIVTTAFNPTHVTAHSVGAREFVLVTASGGIGIAEDDPNTGPVEGGGIALSDAAIDVIDAQSLELVASYPLGPAALSFGPLAIDPTGRVAVAGSAASRSLFAVDLAPLASLASSLAVPESLAGAVIFDAAAPFAIPALAGGAPLASCPGFTVGAAFNAAGDLLFAADQCDGTLARITVDLTGAPPLPVPTARFALFDLLPVAAPLRPDTLGQPRAPGLVRVRCGRPGVDYTGPDVFVSISEPEGLLCAIRIESS